MSIHGRRRLETRPSDRRRAAAARSRAALGAGEPPRGFRRNEGVDLRSACEGVS